MSVIQAHQHKRLLFQIATIVKNSMALEPKAETTDPKLRAHGVKHDMAQIAAVLRIGGILDARTESLLAQYEAKI